MFDSASVLEWLREFIVVFIIFALAFLPAWAAFRARIDK